MGQLLAEACDGGGARRAERDHRARCEIAVVLSVLAASYLERHRRASDIEDAVHADVDGKLLVFEIARARKKAVLRLPGELLLAAARVNVQANGLARPSTRVVESVGGDAPEADSAFAVAGGSCVLFDDQCRRVIGITAAETERRSRLGWEELQHAVRVKALRGRWRDAIDDGRWHHGNAARARKRWEQDEPGKGSSQKTNPAPAETPCSPRGTASTKMSTTRARRRRKPPPI